ncbi:MAG: serine hydrolase [Vulcanimicrobiota bacterium]
MKNLHIFILIILFFCSPVNLAGAADIAPPDELNGDLKLILGTIDGEIGIAVYEMKTGRNFSINGDEPFFLYSMVAVPAMVTYYQMVEDSGVDPNKEIVVDKKDRVWNPTSISLLGAGSEVDLDTLCKLMVVADDFTASNLLIQQIGLDNINQQLQNHNITDCEMQVNLNYNDIIRVMFGLINKIYKTYTPVEIANHIESRNLKPLPDILDQNFDGLNYATPRAMNRLMKKIAERSVVSSIASNRMLLLLKAQQARSGIPSMIPDNYEIAVKTSSTESVLNDSAVIYGRNCTVVITIMGKNIKEDINKLKSKYAAIASIIFDYYENDN